jgi:hypothetical protein
MAKYTVKVDDNYNSGSMEGIYEAGSFDTLDEALNLCKEITVKSLESFYKPGITPNELNTQWLMFGEDPFIYTGMGDVPFSAREFVTDDLCKEIVERMQVIQ